MIIRRWDVDAVLDWLHDCGTQQTKEQQRQQRMLHCNVDGVREQASHVVQEARKQFDVFQRVANDCLFHMSNIPQRVCAYAHMRICVCTCACLSRFKHISVFYEASHGLCEHRGSERLSEFFQCAYDRACCPVVLAQAVVT